MSFGGWFIAVIILLLVIVFVAFTLHRRWQATRHGLPPPPINPFTSGSQGGSRIYPAPSGAIGWIKDKYQSMRGSSSRTGAYEPTGARTGARRGLDPDEAWDARVGTEANGYGPGGYYEEQELGLHPPGPTTGRNDYAGGGYGNDGSLPSYGNEDMGRGRSISRDDIAHIGGGQEGLDQRYEEDVHGVPPKENPFGDEAEASSLRGVSPRPMGGEKDKKPKGAAGNSLTPGNSQSERRSMFSEGT